MFFSQSKMFQLLLLSYFGIENSELEARLDSVDYGEMYPDTYDYPLPSNLAKMVQGTGTNYETNYENVAYPFIFENVDTKQMLKLLKFQLWTDYMVKNTSSEYTKEYQVRQVIKAEANLLETHGFELRDTYVVEPVKFNRYKRY